MEKTCMEETKRERHALVDSAVEGNAEALKKLIEEIQDKVFSLSLRMLGAIPDAAVSGCTEQMHFCFGDYVSD